MMTAGSLAHEREGQSLEYVVHTLRRLPVPRQASTWPLIEYTQSVAQCLLEAICLLQAGSDLPTLNSGCPIHVSDVRALVTLFLGSELGTRLPTSLSGLHPPLRIGLRSRSRSSF